MRIFCPATLLLPHCYAEPVSGPGSYRRIRARMPPLFTCLKVTGPRGRVCRDKTRPGAVLGAAPTNRVAVEDGTGCARLGAVVCPTRRTRLKATRTVCPRSGPAPNPGDSPPKRAFGRKTPSRARHFAGPAVTRNAAGRRPPSSTSAWRSPRLQIYDHGAEIGAGRRDQREAQKPHW